MQTVGITEADIKKQVRALLKRNPRPELSCQSTKKSNDGDQLHLKRGSGFRLLCLNDRKVFLQITTLFFKNQGFCVKINCSLPYEERFLRRLKLKLDTLMGVRFA